MNLRKAIAVFMNRDLHVYYGHSKKDNPLFQTVRGFKKILNWHIETCVLCGEEIMKLPPKEGWGAKQGNKADFILCPWCYDKYDIKYK